MTVLVGHQHAGNSSGSPFAFVDDFTDMPYNNGPSVPGGDFRPVVGDAHPQYVMVNCNEHTVTGFTISSNLGTGAASGWTLLYEGKGSDGVGPSPGIAGHGRIYIAEEFGYMLDFHVLATGGKASAIGSLDAQELTMQCIALGSSLSGVIPIVTYLVGGDILSTLPPVAAYPPCAGVIVSNRGEGSAGSATPYYFLGGGTDHTGFPAVATLLSTSAGRKFPTGVGITGETILAVTATDLGLGHSPSFGKVIAT